MNGFLWFLWLLFTSPTHAARCQASRSSSFRPECEGMPDRVMPSVSWGFNAGTLTINILARGRFHEATVSAGPVETKL